MPIVDLNTPTQLLFQWGWLLVTKANAVVLLLLVVVFLVGAFVRLPAEKSAATTTPTGDATASAVDREGDA
jgi:hypothetical protein